MLRCRTAVRIVSVALSLLLCACSGVHLDEGAINYRKTPPNVHTTPDPLLKKYQDTNNADIRITKEDTLAIYLQQAFLHDFHESANPLKPDECPPHEYGSESTICTGARGEIAIVAKAFEIGDGNDFSFQSNSIDEGRVIYYGDDVRMRQFLNFSYLPIYGPIDYKGKPLGLQLYIMEIDQENKKLTALLTSLAQMGKQALAPSSDILSVLDTLGSNLLSSSGDDVHFRYSATFMPHSPLAQGHYPVLESGHYVLVRRRDRLDEDGKKERKMWESVYLDREEGRLRIKAETCLGEHGRLYVGAPVELALEKTDNGFKWDDKSSKALKRVSGESNGIVVRLPNESYKITSSDTDLTPMLCGLQKKSDKCIIYPLYSRQVKGTEILKTTRLFDKIKKDTDCPLYTDNTYLTLHITKGLDATTLNSQNTLYKALRQSLSDDAELGVKPIEEAGARNKSRAVFSELYGYYLDLANKSTKKEHEIRYKADKLVNELIKYAKQNRENAAAVKHKAEKEYAEAMADIKSIAAEAAKTALDTAKLTQQTTDTDEANNQLEIAKNYYTAKQGEADIAKAESDEMNAMLVPKASPLKDNDIEELRYYIRTLLDNTNAEKISSLEKLRNLTGTDLEGVIKALAEQATPGT